MEKNFWKIQAMVLVLFLTCLGVGATVYNVYGGNKMSSLQSSMENNYNLAYYNLSQGVSMMNEGLDIFAVSTSRTYQVEILDGITSGAELAQGGLNGLSYKDSELSEMQKQINQTGDYAKFLMKKLASGSEITQAEKDNLEKLNKNVKAYSNELTSIGEWIESGEYSFLNDVSKSDGELSASYKKVSGENMEYPEIVYEGLFSDGVEEAQPKGLSLTEMSAENLQSRIPFYLDGDIKSATEKASVKTGNLQTVIFETEYFDGTMGSIQLTKRGGELVGFSLQMQDDNGQTDTEACLASAKSYLESRGIKNMKVFRTTELENGYTFAFCKKTDNVYILPQSVVVSVSKSDAKIYSVSCLSYLLNRDNISFDSENVLSKEEIKTHLSQNIASPTYKLCIANINGTDKLCYEVKGSYNNQTYYIYLDAKTGNEVFIERM